MARGLGPFENRLSRKAHQGSSPRPSANPGNGFRLLLLDCRTPYRELEPVALSGLISGAGRVDACLRRGQSLRETPPMDEAPRGDGLLPWRDPSAIARRFRELLDDRTPLDRIPDVIAQEFHLPSVEAHSVLRGLIGAEEERQESARQHEKEFRLWLGGLYLRPGSVGHRGTLLSIVSAALGVAAGGAIWYCLPPGRYLIAIAVVPALLVYRAAFVFGARRIHRTLRQHEPPPSKIRAGRDDR